VQSKSIGGLFTLDPSKQILFVNFARSTDDAAGFDATKRYMMTTPPLARDSGAKSINTVASMEMGGYAWPRAGFEVAEQGFEFTKAQIFARFNQISSLLTPDQATKVSAMLAKFDKDTPIKLSKLDEAVSAQAIALAGDGLRGVRGQPTLGKALLAGTQGTYTLPRSKFAPMGKALAKALGFTKGYPEFDADQPRDEQGQWTSGGGGGSATEKPIKDFTGPKPADFDGPNAGNSWRLAASAAIGFGAVAAGVGTYVILRRGLAPAQVVVNAARTASGKPLLLGVESGADDVAALIRNTMDRLPASHLAAFRANGSSIYAVKNLGVVEQAMVQAPVVTNTMYGFFHPTLNAVVIPRSLMVRGSEHKLAPEVLQRVLVHEVAHALDAKGAGLGYISRTMQKTMVGEYLAFLKNSPAEGALIHSWFLRNYKTPTNIRNEIFAEVYSAKYLNKGNPFNSQYTFFGASLSEHDVAKHFPNTMSLMDNMDLSKPSGLLGFRHYLESNLIGRSTLAEEGARLRSYLNASN
jgi:hypothetical protein